MVFLDDHQKLETDKYTDCTLQYNWVMMTYWSQICK